MAINTTTDTVATIIASSRSIPASPIPITHKFYIYSETPLNLGEWLVPIDNRYEYTTGTYELVCEGREVPDWKALGVLSNIILLSTDFYLVEVVVIGEVYIKSTKDEMPHMRKGWRIFPLKIHEDNFFIPPAFHLGNFQESHRIHTINLPRKANSFIYAIRNQKST